MGHFDRLRSIAEAPHDDMVGELTDAEAIEDFRHYILNIDPRSSEAQLEATYLASDEDAQLSLIRQLGASPRKVRVVVSCLSDTTIVWWKPKLKEPTLKWSKRAFAG